MYCYCIGQNFVLWQHYLFPNFHTILSIFKKTPTYPILHCFPKFLPASFPPQLLHWLHWSSSSWCQSCFRPTKTKTRRLKLRVRSKNLASPNPTNRHSMVEAQDRIVLQPHRRIFCGFGPEKICWIKEWFEMGLMI